MNDLSDEQSAWLDDAHKRTVAKLERTSRRIKDCLAFISIDGSYIERPGDPNRLSWWTNGFWPGLLWLMFRETKDNFYKMTAEACETKLDQALLDYDGLHHDVGFMWSLASVADFKLTGSDRARKRGMLAASLLASRFNVKGGYIRAWNENRVGWAIVDCLMNLPILHWASEQAKDPRFSHVARAHADMALRHILRPDGSANHIVVLDPDTGNLLETPGGQGYGPGSSWSRGQTWAIYGFALSFRHTGDRAYLDAAKRSAHYFLANVGDDWLPDIDFRAPAKPANKDSTAGAIAACGLLEIASHVGEFEKPLYRNTAIKLLRALDAKCGAWDDPAEEGLLLHGAHSWPHNYANYPPDTPIIYGDYYFFEAIARLKGKEELFW